MEKNKFCILHKNVVTFFGAVQLKYACWKKWWVILFKRPHKR